MLYVICYMLYVICYMLYVICYLLFVICYLLFVVCCFLFFVFCLLFFVYCLLFLYPTLTPFRLFGVSFTLVDLSGKLLIRAMISLKHQGAAYAAHKSLQRLCEIICNDEDSASLPQEWSVKLLNVSII